MLRRFLEYSISGHQELAQIAIRAAPCVGRNEGRRWIVDVDHLRHGIMVVGCIAKRLAVAAQPPEQIIELEEVITGRARLSVVAHGVGDDLIDVQLRGGDGRAADRILNRRRLRNRDCRRARLPAQSGGAMTGGSIGVDPIQQHVPAYGIDVDGCGRRDSRVILFKRYV